jgi:hypothetical protein
MLSLIGSSFVKRTLLCLLVCCGCLAIPASSARADGATIGISGVWTYLYVPAVEPPGAAPAVPIELAPLGLAAGDTLRLEQLGDFSNGPAGDTLTRMIGVFSGSGVLLAPELRYRVQDAIDAGTDFVTGTAYWDGLPTDIPEDFWIDDIEIVIPAGATHLFVTAYDTGYWDNGDPDGDFAVRLTQVHVTEVPPGASPPRPRLLQNAPNPFNPRTTIRYELPVAGRAALEIYDARGRRIRTLVDAVQEAGPQSVVWDGCDGSGVAVASGAYLYRLTVAGHGETRGMTVVR